MTNGIRRTFIPSPRASRLAGRCLLPLAILLLGACATHPGPLGAVSDIVVTGGGVDNAHDAPLCQEFKPGPLQLRAFLRNAVLITPRQEHDFFLHGPCYVRGTLSTRYDSWHWELRNGGTARLTSAAGDDSFLLADPREKSSLGED